jgi:hypothetical protein
LTKLVSSATKNVTKDVTNELASYVRLGTLALQVIESCEYCKAELRKKYDGMSETNQTSLVSNRGVFDEVVVTNRRDNRRII